MHSLNTSITSPSNPVNTGTSVTGSSAYSASLNTAPVDPPSDLDLKLQPQSTSETSPSTPLISDHEVLIIPYQNSSGSPLMPEIAQLSKNSTAHPDIQKIFQDCRNAKTGQLNRELFKEQLTQYFEKEGYSPEEIQSQTTFWLDESHGGDDGECLCQLLLCCCWCAACSESPGWTMFCLFCCLIIIIAIIAVALQQHAIRIEHSPSPSIPTAVPAPTTPLSQAPLLLMQAR